MLEGRRSFRPVLTSACLLTGLAGAGCLIVAGCLPTEHSSSRAKTSSAESRAVEAASANTKKADSARPASFVERIDALSIAPPPAHETFGPLLAYRARGSVSRASRA
jgi:hypothetical protein